MGDQSAQQLANQTGPGKSSSTRTSWKRTDEQSGDQAYSYMIEISILTEILGSEITDPKIQSAARSILELCSEMSQEPVSLLWPLLTAGACSTSEENRNWVRQLFDVFRPHYCQDLETAVCPSVSTLRSLLI
jgi:hypothetical protein